MISMTAIVTDRVTSSDKGVSYFGPAPWNSPWHIASDVANTAIGTPKAIIAFHVIDGPRARPICSYTCLQASA
jgi:hypothetical protein